MNIAKDFVIPTAILTIICLVAAGALVLTHSVTQPIIDREKREVEEAAMREVMSTADSFTTLDATKNPDGVTQINVADNGVGAAVAVQGKGYNGSKLIALMVGVKSDGSIEKISIVDHGETSGIGDKVVNDTYLANFVGKTVDTYNDVDAVSGSTMSSAGVKSALKSAFNGYAVASGGEAAPEPEKGLTDALIAEHYPDVTPEPVESPEADVEVLKCGEAGYIVTAGGEGFGGTMKVAVLFDAEGTILWSVVTETAESPGIGDKVETDEFAGKFVGKKNAEGVDTIAGATFSSTAYIDAVNSAATVFETIKGA